MSVTYRPPSVAEAVDWLLMNAQPWARTYRRSCIAFWRELVGEAFAIEVSREFLRAWKRRKKRGNA